MYGSPISSHCMDSLANGYPKRPMKIPNERAAHGPKSHESDALPVAARISSSVQFTRYRIPTKMMRKPHQSRSMPNFKDSTLQKTRIPTLCINLIFNIYNYNIIFSNIATWRILICKYRVGYKSLGQILIPMNVCVISLYIYIHIYIYMVITYTYTLSPSS